MVFYIVENETKICKTLKSSKSESCKYPYNGHLRKQENAKIVKLFEVRQTFQKDSENKKLFFIQLTFQKRFGFKKYNSAQTNFSEKFKSKRLNLLKSHF